MAERRRNPFLQVPLGRTRVFARKESLGKSNPSEWCCTRFSNGEQLLAINVVRVSMYFEIFFALWRPCTEHSRTAVRWGCQEEQHHGLGRHAAVPGARVASSVMGCSRRDINTYAPNVRMYWYVPSVQDLIHGVSSLRAVEVACAHHVMIRAQYACSLLLSPIGS